MKKLLLNITFIFINNMTYAYDKDHPISNEVRSLQIQAAMHNLESATSEEFSYIPNCYDLEKAAELFETRSDDKELLFWKDDKNRIIAANLEFLRDFANHLRDASLQPIAGAVRPPFYEKIANNKAKELYLHAIAEYIVNFMKVYTGIELEKDIEKLLNVAKEEFIKAELEDLYQFTSDDMISIKRISKEKAMKYLEGTATGKTKLIFYYYASRTLEDLINRKDHNEELLFWKQDTGKLDAVNLKDLNVLANVLKLASMAPVIEATTPPLYEKVANDKAMELYLNSVTHAVIDFTEVYTGKELETDIEKLLDIAKEGFTRAKLGELYYLTDAMIRIKKMFEEKAMEYLEETATGKTKLIIDDYAPGSLQHLISTKRDDKKLLSWKDDTEKPDAVYLQDLSLLANLLKLASIIPVAGAINPPFYEKVVNDQAMELYLHSIANAVIEFAGIYVGLELERDIEKLLDVVKKEFTKAKLEELYHLDSNNIIKIKKMFKEKAIKHLEETAEGKAKLMISYTASRSLKDYLGMKRDSTEMLLWKDSTEKLNAVYLGKLRALANILKLSSMTPMVEAVNPLSYEKTINDEAKELYLHSITYAVIDFAKEYTGKELEKDIEKFLNIAKKGFISAKLGELYYLTDDIVRIKTMFIEKAIESINRL